MTVNHPNFYENHKEAIMRIRGTVVLYDGQPGYVHAVCAHKPDGIFRVYFEPLGPSKGEKVYNQDFYILCSNVSPEHPTLGPSLDAWLQENKDTSIIRKNMNSPLFNRFRPFPLGMCNLKGDGAVYLERMPDRPKTEQGLTKSMINEYSLSSLGSRKSPPHHSGVDIFSPALKYCILGEYPSANDCLKNLRDPKVQNDSAAFDRHFALVRGPIDIMFLAYKQDVIGVLPNNDFSRVQLGNKFGHTREVVENLRLFNAIS